MLVRSERDNLEKTLNEVTQKLSMQDQELTIQNSAQALKAASSNKNNSDTLESSMMHLNPLISELSQPSLSVYIYNPSNKVIFQTNKKTIPFTPTLKKQLSLKTLDNISGYLVVNPVISQKTNRLIGYVQIFYELTSFYEIRQKLILTLIILELAGIVLSVLLGYALAAYFLRPVKKMADTVNAIKAEPQLDIRIPNLKAKDELTYLADAFNNMLDRMQKFIDSQQQFVEDVSHELRTPVAIIEGHLKLLNRWGKDDPSVLEESLAASLQEISRMKTLVQEMLDLSRVEQVSLTQINELTEVEEVTNQTFSNFKLLYPDFSFIMDNDLPKQLKIKMFRNHFEQMLIILLDNAVKYSTNRKEIHLTLSSSNNQLEIAIQDFGEGISEDDLEKIFNRFYRVDKARSRFKGGNGLGLSIAQQLAENYGGKISADSVLGKGTIFYVTFPIVSTN